MTTVARAAGDRAAPEEVSINSVPISIALVAGGLSVVNPCGFPLLPAFLSFYFGADEEQLPPASTRVAQGLVVGALVALGFLGFFALVGLPVSFGVGAIARAVRWAGLATGALLAIVGPVTLFGIHGSAAAPSSVACSAGASLRCDVAVRGWLWRGLARLHTAALPGARRRIARRRQADRVRRLRDRDGRRADGPVGWSCCSQSAWSCRS